MSDPTSRLNAARVFPVGLVVLLVFVVLIRAPSDAPRPVNAAEGGATEAPAAGEPPVEPPVVPSVEPYVRTGCFRSGSSRDEVRAVMGAPDAVDRGAWEYGQSWVAFGYGVVLDFSNEGGELRLCE